MSNQYILSDKQVGLILGLSSVICLLEEMKKEKVTYCCPAGGEPIGPNFVQNRCPPLPDFCSATYLP